MGGYFSSETWDGRDVAQPNAAPSSWGSSWWHSSETAVRADNAAMLSSEDAALKVAAERAAEEHQKAESDRFLKESGFEIWLAENFKTGLDSTYRMQKHQREFATWVHSDRDGALALREKQRRINLGDHVTQHAVELKATDWA
jgi:hypothetical protein|tara:strand:- start:183 stop:611 length:429 start_codon:yes stop_codon:yes gene_type:complete